MQAFLPYEDFEESAWSLDRQRLGKQRVEAMQILTAIDLKHRRTTDLEYLERVEAGELMSALWVPRPTVSSPGWSNHPAVLMWEGHETALCDYGVAVCREWKSRGYRDGCERFFLMRIADAYYSDDDPPWLGNEEFHRSHRMMLMWKDPGHYAPLFLHETYERPDYLWPVRS